MRYLESIALLSIFSVFLTGCGGGANPDKQETGSHRVGTENVNTVAGTPNFHGDNSVSGTGSIRSVTPLDGGVDGEGNFSLKFQLAEDGKVILVTFSDIGLTSGIEVEFARVSNSTALKVTLRQGSTSYDASSAFSSLNASYPLTIAVDIHNGEKPAHMILWDDSNGVSHEDDFIFNTGVVPNSSPGDGKGVYWGFHMENASVFSMTKTDVRMEHDH